MQPERRCYPRKELQASIDYSSEKKLKQKILVLVGFALPQIIKFLKEQYFSLLFLLKIKELSKQLERFYGQKKSQTHIMKQELNFFH